LPNTTSFILYVSILLFVEVCCAYQVIWFLCLKALGGFVFGLHTDFPQDNDNPCSKQGKFFQVCSIKCISYTRLKKLKNCKIKKVQTKRFRLFAIIRLFFLFLILQFLTFLTFLALCMRYICSSTLSIFQSWTYRLPAQLRHDSWIS